MLLNPTLEECLHEAAKLEPPLPVSEAKQFFYYYESIGWKVGRARMPMKSFAIAMAGWHNRWKAQNGKQEGEPPKLSGADKMLKRDELNRALAEIKQLRESYDSHLDMRLSDRTRLQKLKGRADQLRRELGMIV